MIMLTGKNLLLKTKEDRILTAYLKMIMLTGKNIPLKKKED
jgi:hypothetical protein